MKWSDFAPLVMPYAIGCPMPVLEHHAKMVSIEWCKKTMCWQESLDPVLSDGTPLLEMEAPTGTQVAKVLSVKVGERERDLVAPDAGRTMARNGHPGDFVFTMDNETLQIYQAPTLDEPVVVDAALAPSLTATGMPDRLFNQHGPDIAKGIIAAIKALPGQAFSDPMESDRKQAEYMARRKVIAAKTSLGTIQAKPQRPAKFY